MTLPAEPIATLPGPLEGLPGDSRLWLLAARTPFTEAQASGLREGLEAILGAWRHKGVRYEGRAALLEGQVVAVAEPLLASAPSGCAIDGMLRRVRRLGEDLGLAWADPAVEVLVGGPGGFRPLAKADLGEAARTGEIHGGTSTVDLSPYRLSDLGQGLVKPLADTWVARSHALRPAP